MAPALIPGLFVVLWSTGFIGAKLGIAYAPTANFLSLRFLLVLAVLFPLCLLTGARWPAPRRLLHAGLAGLLLQAGYLWGVFEAVRLGMPAGMSALITGLQPLLTACLGGWLLGERLARVQWLGLVLGLGGVVLVVGERLTLHGLGPGAVAAAGLGLLSITLGTVWQKRHGAGIDLRTGTAIQFGAALVVMAPLALLETEPVRWSTEFAFALVWLALVLSIGAIFLLLHMIRLGAATQVASLFYLVPPTTAVMAWLLFDERYSLLAAAGMGLAMLAVWLVTGRRRPA